MTAPHDRTDHRAEESSPPASGPPPPPDDSASTAGLTEPEGRPAAADASGEPAARQGRFTLLRPHAKGGLGEVFLARDEELHRDVALKRLQERHADDAVCLRRFLVEAEVTAKLEHPGVVPVHGLVHDEEGRPWYAMRFVQGQTLHDAIRQFHEASGGVHPRRAPGERTLAFRQLLQRFVAVCQTVAYAHSKGVIHRDLKPANVMLGKYGETLVVDWGLARRLGEAPTAAERELEESLVSVRGELPTDEATQMGSAVGTPSFMSPEQAAGRWDVVGPASDVYCLGATLYAVLTGQSPVQGKDTWEILQKVQRGDFARPRHINKEVPAALEAVCMKAMALQPEGRYATATALAQDVERWLADEPVAAYREPAVVRLRRWGRHHRPQVASLAAAVVVALVLGGAGLGWWQWQRALTARAVQADLEAAEAVLQEDKDPAVARPALERARARLGHGGMAGLRARLEAMERDVYMAAALEEARLQAAAATEGGFDYAGADKLFGEAFTRYDLDLVAMSREAAAERLGASAIRIRLLAGLDDWASVRDELRAESGTELRAVAEQADTDPWRQRLRAAARGRDQAALEHLAEEAEALDHLPVYLVLLGQNLRAAGSPEVEAWLRQAQQCHPADFWLNFNLAGTIQRKKPPDLAEKVRFYQAALALRPQSPVVYNNLGLVLSEQQKLAEGEAAIRQAIALQPGFSVAYNNLGGVLHAQKKLAEAEAAYRKAIAIQPNNSWAYSNLGNVLREQQKLVEAEATCRKAIAIQPELSAAYNHLGLVLSAQKKLAEAEAAYHKAIAIQPELSAAYNNLGVVLRAQKRLAEAEAAYRKAIVIQPDFAEAYDNLASMLVDQQKLPEAEATIRQAIALQPKDAGVHYTLSTILLAQKKLAEGDAAIRQAIALQPGFPAAYNNLGGVLHAQKRLTEAEAAFRQAIALQPDDAEAHCNLGIALKDQGRFAEALASFQRGHEFGSRDPTWRYPSGRWVQAAERLVALDAKFLKMVKGEVQPADTAERIALARFGQNHRQVYLAAARLYAEAFAAEPKRADDLKTHDRYNAACAAALAGCGQGKDADKLDEKERARWRKQALNWLRADLAAWAKHLDGGKPEARTVVQQKMQHWQQGPDFAGVRGDALAKLPEAEREPWRQFWADVAALLQRAGDPK